MKLAKYYLQSNDFSPQSNRLSSMGAAWFRFGDELLVYANENPSETPVGMSALPLQEHLANIKRENMHLVVQKGRVFQQEHPEIPVITDRGRFLLVDIAPERVEKIQVGDIPCYTISPLQDNQVVFETVAPPAARAAVPGIQQLVNQLSRSSFEADLIKLVSYPTRYSTSTHYANAANWVRGQLDAMNYLTQSQSITVSGSTSQNIIADKPGTGAGNRNIIIVTAHLDSINHPDGPLSSAPGADDNGSGSAGLLQIARVFRGYSNLHDLRFIFFGGEEQGLFGSYQYVANLPAAEKSRIRAVVNMDMIGSLNSTVPGVLLEGAPLSQNVIDGLITAATTYTHLSIQTALVPHDSDHVPFIEEEIPAVLTIEGADGANDKIHSKNDTINHINYDLALEILRMNVAFIAASSSGQ
jgi:Zn-dependent M28 family amino/carboxypeptidase